MTLKEAAARIERVDESSTIYDVIGEEGIMRMVAAFYRRVPEDDVLGPMYPPDDLAGAEQRLRDFLIYRLGGPERYIVERGHPRPRMRHMPFAINQLARDRWVTTMAAAMREADLPEEVLRALQSFFEQIATFLINSPD